MSESGGSRYLKPAIILAAVYVFLFSIKLLGHSFKLFGSGFAETMLQMTANPFVGLFTGIIATSLIQSSSTTTSIVVGLVAGNAMSLPNAIPIIMGANIGTTITNTLVSFGHVTERVEFRRAFAAGIVHDFFNICTVLVLFPLEMRFHLVQRTATLLEESFTGVGGLKMFNPLKAIIDPVIHRLDGVLPGGQTGGFIMALVALVLMFSALSLLVKTIRSLVLEQLEVIIQTYLFRNDVLGLLLGFLITAVVQSSSITTSLIIPLAGAGLVTVRQLFPYMLGANLGTTMTAILAAMATQSPVAVTVAFAHLCFNLYGMVIFFPLKGIPIRMAQWVAEIATRSRRHTIVCIVLYLLCYFLPLAFLFTS